MQKTTQIQVKVKRTSIFDPSKYCNVWRKYVFDEETCLNHHEFLELKDQFTNFINKNNQKMWSV